MITLAIARGRLLGEEVNILKKAGYPVDNILKDSRKLIFEYPSLKAKNTDNTPDRYTPLRRIRGSRLRYSRHGYTHGRKTLPVRAPGPRHRKMQAW